MQIDCIDTTSQIMENSKQKQRPGYIKTLHSRYYRLPKVIWDLIWTYDDRYRIEFKNSTLELNTYFNRNRVICRLTHDIHIYSIYSSRNMTYVANLYNNVYSYSSYILKKIKIFGDPIVDNNLNGISLRPRNILSRHSLS
jgi:hypothetical protein